MTYAIEQSYLQLRISTPYPQGGNFRFGIRGVLTVERTEYWVYFELLPRGYQVYVGKSGDTELNIVAIKNGVCTYFQVTANMANEGTFNRELRPLKNIPDNYEKIVLAAERYTVGNYDGIQVKYLADWLLKK